MKPDSDTTNKPARDHHDRETVSAHHVDRYWKANIKLVLILMSVWFVVSFGFGILLVEPLNQFSLFGFKLGFWWAQQGSIFVFVGLIGVYVVLMKRIDKRFGVDDD